MDCSEIDNTHTLELNFCLGTKAMYVVFYCIALFQGRLIFGYIFHKLYVSDVIVL